MSSFPLRFVFIASTALALGACGGGGGSGYVAANPGTAPLALPAKIPGACKVDVESVFDEKLCAEPRGPFNLCIKNLKHAFGEMLTELVTKACVGGDEGVPYGLSLHVLGLTRTNENRPATGLATIGNPDATEGVQTFTMSLRFEVLDTYAQPIVARDFEVSRETKGLDFDTAGAGLVEDATKQIVDVVTKQAALGWSTQSLQR